MKLLLIFCLFCVFAAVSGQEPPDCPKTVTPPPPLPTPDFAYANVDHIMTASRMAALYAPPKRKIIKHDR